MPLMQQRHYEFIADELAPMLPWPNHIVALADKLASTNDKFNKEKFITRATKAWEDNNLNEEDIDDFIPQLHDLP